MTSQTEADPTTPRDTAPSGPLPASSQVYETLRARIVSFGLAPGERLSRPELAERFGVSASPLREALQRLERDGLIATFRQSRTVVTHLDPAILKQEQFLRTGVECEIAHVLALAPDKSVLKKAGAIIRMQRVLIDEPDQMELFRNLDDDFHGELFRAAGHGALHVTLKERISQMARLRSLDLPREGKLVSVVEMHEKVLDAMLRSDPAGATEAMRAHLSGTIARLPEIMAQYPDYFVRATGRAKDGGTP